MFHKLLVPVDGSPSATAALLQAIEVAKAFKASIAVIAVYDAHPFVVSAAEYGYTHAQFSEVVKAEASTNAQRAKDIVSETGLKAEILVRESAKTWRGILEAADNSHSDMIVMGSHGRSGLDRLVMGSVTQSVLQRTTLPVLVVQN